MSIEADSLPITLAPKFRRRMHLHRLGLCGLPTLLMTGREIEAFESARVLTEMTGEAISKGLYTEDKDDWTLLIRTSADPLPGSLTHSSPAFCLTGTDSWRDLSSKHTLDETALKAFLRAQGHFLVHIDQPTLQRKCVHGRVLTTNAPYPITQLDLVTGAMHARAIDRMKPKPVSITTGCEAPHINEVRVDAKFPKQLLNPMLYEVSLLVERARAQLLDPASVFGQTAALTFEFRTFFPGTDNEQTHIMDYLLEQNYRN